VKDVGGGPSGFFSRPAFQHSLPGSLRLLPDISWIADPFTGVVSDLTEDGGLSASRMARDWRHECLLSDVLWSVGDCEPRGWRATRP
jgi:hypothetical protein